MCLLTIQTVKNLNFTNPRWRTAAILKIVKLLCLCNRLTDFDLADHSKCVRSGTTRTHAHVMAYLPNSFI